MIYARAESKCAACTHDAVVFYGEGGRRGMFLCGEHYRLWQDGDEDEVLDAIARRHTSRMKRREAKLGTNPDG